MAPDTLERIATLKDPALPQQRAQVEKLAPAKLAHAQVRSGHVYLFQFRHNRCALPAPRWLS